MNLRIHITTDASVFKGTQRADYGPVIHFPDKTCEKLSIFYDHTSSNFEEDALSIEASPHHVCYVFTIASAKCTDIVIFRDTKSALKSLHGDEQDSSHIRSLAKTVDEVIKIHAVVITLQWISGHTNIPGNEIADRPSKQGTSHPQINNTISTAHKVIKSIIKKEWVNAWALESIRSDVFKNMITSNKKMQ